MTQMPCSTAHCADRAHLVRRVDRAGRVGRRAEQQHLGARRPRGLELLDGDQVALVLAGEDLDRHAAGQRDRLGVRGPVRRGQQHLVARVHHRREGLVDRLLAAVGDQHLLRGDLVAGVAQGLGGDRGLAARAGRRPGCSGGSPGPHTPRSRPRRCSPGSGSPARPAPKPITGRPAALSALALASTASVADSAIPPIRAEIRRWRRRGSAGDALGSLTSASSHPVAARPGPHRPLAVRVRPGRPLSRTVGPRWLTTAMLTHAHNPVSTWVTARGRAAVGPL